MKNIDTAKHSSSSAYNPLIGATVVDTMGTRAHIQSLYPEGDATIAVLLLEDGKTVNADLSCLERDKDCFSMPVLFEDPSDEFEDPSDTDHHEWQEEIKIPMVQEEINVDKRRVDTGKGIRAKKHVLEHEEIVDVPLTEEILSVEHIAVGKTVSEDNLPQARQEGDVYIIPVFEEVYVVEKKIRLKEEVRIIKKRKESSEAQKVRLKSEQVEIEHFDDKASSD